jgi:hypothetical protein
MKYSWITGLFLLGVVDVIEGDFAEVELINHEGEIVYTHLPIALFPCEIKEGDMFHFEYADGVTEICCGEPQE